MGADMDFVKGQSFPPNEISGASGRIMPSTTIYYDPADPSNNQAALHKKYSTLDLIGLSVVWGAMALLGFIVAGACAADLVVSRRR